MQGPALNIFGESAPIHDADSEPVVGEGKRKIQLVNRCEFDVWVGFEGKPLPLDGGIGLGAGKQLTVKVDEQWTAGRIWGRTGCFKSGDKIRCATGDCGNPANKYKLQCGGQGAMKPTTLAEFTLNGYKGTDYYDISNVDGYNIGIMIQAIGGKAADGVEDQYNCKPVSCNMDMGACPSELMVTNEDGSLSCASISTAVNLPLSRRANPFLDQIFKDADKRALVMCDCACGENCGCESPDSKYCCSPYNEPTPIENGGKCYVEQWPTSPFAFGSMDKRYDQVFKSQCPMAYSWQFDDHRSLIQCLEAEYAVTFCPDPKYNKDASGAALPRENTSDVFDDSDWFYLYEDDWDESLLDGFETKLNLEHKIDDAYDDDLSTFIAKKALEKALFPITTYRMALLGYIRAAEALKVFIAQLFKANPGELYDAQGKTLEEIEKSIHHEMYRDPGNSMFDCRQVKTQAHVSGFGDSDRT
ncbi:thaumatin [Powellomyces hirtus]|nr:thaumatin [Powellomyces hirtus]